MKAARLMFSSRKVIGPLNTLSANGASVRDGQSLRNYSSGGGLVTSSMNLNAGGTYPNVMFVDFAIFKGKAALTVKPVLPKFVTRESGVSAIDKKGVVMLKFMPAIGQRKYDPEKKQAFALSPTEVGCLISLDPGESCEFFHDPSMKSSLEGQVKKTLNVSPIPSENGGYFFSLTVNNSILKSTERISVPVTKAELAVMRTAFSFVLPHIMGWDRLVGQQYPANTGLQDTASLRLGQAKMPFSAKSEWSR